MAEGKPEHDQRGKEASNGQSPGVADRLLGAAPQLGKSRFWVGTKNGD